MLLLCQFYLTLPELQDANGGAESQPSYGIMEPAQCCAIQLLMSTVTFTFLRGLSQSAVHLC